MAVVLAVVQMFGVRWLVLVKLLRKARALGTEGATAVSKVVRISGNLTAHLHQHSPTSRHHTHRPAIDLALHIHPPETAIQPSMGSVAASTTVPSLRRVCASASTPIPDPALSFGLSKTDASFAALLWLLAEGPP